MTATGLLWIYFFLCIKLQERLIKIQCTHISKSYLKFWHVPELDHSVHRGINPLLIFCEAFCKLPKPLFRQFPIYIYKHYKHFGLYLLLLLLLLFKISDFSLLFMQQLRFIPPPSQKNHPLFSSNL